MPFTRASNRKNKKYLGINLTKGRENSFWKLENVERKFKRSK